MDQAERQKRIVDYLRVKPVSHGQVYTFQIAIPDSESVEISPERFDLLSNSLTQQTTNLIPIVVRRTEAYSEEKDYEVVYGADWCIVAKELDIEKLWVWVFDMSDEDAATAKAEMEKLAGNSDSSTTSPEIVKQFESLLKRYVDNSIERKLKQYLGLFKELVGELKEEFTPIDKEIQELRSAVNRASNSVVYASMTVQQLRAEAKELGLKGYSNKKKGELINELLNIKAA